MYNIDINKLKYKRTQYIKKKKNYIDFLKFGNFGLKTKKLILFKEIHLKLLLKYLTRKLKKKGKFWIKTFFNITLTKKSNGARMGGGIGKINQWGIFLKPGKILLEIYSNNDNKKSIYNYLKYCINKLPKGLKIISNFNNF
jgi:ribosomal protein L16